MTRPWTVLHLFAGAGGGALGFKRAGFVSVGSFDVDPAACRDLEMLTGEAATVADLATLEPHELRAACTERPDVVFTSPPCKAFSGCLPSAKSCTPKYVDLSDLSLRGVWLALEAWKDQPPALFILENVPRIQSRGRHWLDQIGGLLHAYGYAVRETTHDAGELGGLAQRRRRFLLVARHMAQVPEFLYLPPTKRVRGVGEVLGELPVPLPGSPAGGPMHRLPRMSAMNGARLALIPAGGDWRDLPAAVALAPREGRQNGGFGVEGWDDPSHAVVAEGTVRNTRASVADPRVEDRGRYRGGHGVVGWDEQAPTVRGAHEVRLAPASVSDPRVAGSPHRHNGKYGVEAWDGPAHAVIAEARTGKAWAGVADPRMGCEPRAGVLGIVDQDAPVGAVVGNARTDNGRYAYADPRVTCDRREGSMGVRGWDQASAPVIGHATHHNHPSQVADPRLTHDCRRGNFGVTGWAQPSHTVIGDARAYKGANVADPRVPIIAGPELDLDSQTPTHIIIRAADGTWHRPMTTLELAVLQGFPARHNGDWLVLDGRSHKGWRQRIGNAVPPAAAEAIAREAATTLAASADGRLLLSGRPVWVVPPRQAGGAGRQGRLDLEVAAS